MHAILLDEHRCKNSQLNTGKLNSSSYLKDHSSWAGQLDYQNANMIKCMQNSKCYQSQNKFKCRSNDYFTRHRKKPLTKSSVIFEESHGKDRYERNIPQYNKSYL